MKINVQSIAKLANIPITSEDARKLDVALQASVKHIERLSVIDTKSVEETAEVNHLHNVWRDDEVRPSFTQAEALMNAKHVFNGFFVVPVVIHEAVES